MNWTLFHRKVRPAPAGEPEPPKLGLALGGGSVRGAAHLGVLSVLEREGVRPHVVAGTSVGAIVGAGVAAGLGSAEMLSLFLAARWATIVRPSWHSKLSMFDTHPLGELLARATSAATFADLRIPFAAVATDILNGRSVVMTEGPLAEAVVASAALPVIFEPVRREGHLLVDGGISDNVPVLAARSLGADFVLAVDVMPPPDGTFEPTDVRDMLLLSFSIMQHSGQEARRDADLLITPDLIHVSPSDFAQARLAYDAGVAAAESALPELLRGLERDVGRTGEDAADG